MSVPRYWREIPQRYNLQAAKCGVCKEFSFPPRSICPTCRRESIGHMTRVNLAGRGTILEFTRVHKAATGYEDQTPYIVALVQTEEGPRIMGQIVDCEDITVKRRMRVEAAFRRIGSDGEAGVIHYGIKWRPVATGPLEESSDESSEE